MLRGTPTFTTAQRGSRDLHPNPHPQPSMQQCSPDPCLPVLLQCLWPLGLARMYTRGFQGISKSLIAESVACMLTRTAEIS